MSTIWKPIGSPTLLNIPYFAMPAKGAECRATCLMSDIKTLQAELGDLAATGLHENEDKQFLGFYTTREYVMPKAARYQNWLVFRNKKAVDEFFDLFPQFG